MNDFLKSQLRLTIIATVIWVVALCIALSEYPYHIAGRMSCFEAAIIPVIIAGVVLAVFWAQWAKDYKEQK